MIETHYFSMRRNPEALLKREREGEKKNQPCSPMAAQSM